MKHFLILWCILEVFCLMTLFCCEYVLKLEDEKDEN